MTDVRAAPRPAAELVALLREARARTLSLVDDLTDEQLLGPRLAIVNPLLWEIGHVAWFQEKWILRHWAGRPPLREDGDALYDSSAVAHDVRWDLPLPDRRATLEYMERVLDEVSALLARREPGPEGTYFTLLGLYHEYMHAEAFTYTRQTLGYPPPPGVPPVPREALPRGLVGRDVDVPGGELELGARPDAPFVFDNEKWAHPVRIEPFAIATTAVTELEFAAFVDDHGYEREELWSPEGWAWRLEADARHPVYWELDVDRGWMRRSFDRWEPIDEAKPVLHVNFYEAEAYCRWAGRRLPTEAEWEAAAAGEPGPDGSLGPRKRRYPWGDEPPTAERVHMDFAGLGPVSVAAHPAGDSAFGVRQLLGNVWEWTTSDFGPYPGFVPDPYRDYSQPWFGDHKVLRGGCWCTRSELIRNTWRNFYRPDRRDVWAGFRTCAAD